MATIKKNNKKATTVATTTTVKFTPNKLFFVVTKKGMPIAEATFEQEYAILSKRFTSWADANDAMMKIYSESGDNLLGIHSIDLGE